MSDNPLIEGFLNLHENEAKRKISGAEVFGAIGKAHAGALKGVRDAVGSGRIDAISSGVRGAVDSATLGLGKYARAAVDTNIKNLGSLAGISEPTTFSKEIEQEREKDIAAQQNEPAAWDAGDKLATAAGVATGIGGVAKTIAGAVVKSAARKAAANAARKYTSKDFELGVGRLNQFPDEVVSSMKPPAQPSQTLNLTPQMRVPSTPKPQAAPVPQTTLNLTPQMRVQGTRKVIPFPKNTRLTTEEQTDPSKGNTEMSTNPFIKGFFDIEEARAKNTNIFDESKKLTAAQKKNLDKNDNDKIDAEDFKMLRKEEAIEEAKGPKPGHNARVMARNISKVLRAAKPDFLDIDKDGDKEEPMKKAAADMKKEEVELDENLGKASKKMKFMFNTDPRDVKQRIKDASPEFRDQIRNTPGKLGGPAELQRRLARKMKEEVGFSEEEVELDEVQSMSDALKNALSKPEPGSKLHRNIQAHNNSIKYGSKLGDDNHNLMTKAPPGHRFDKKGMIRLGEEVGFSEEEIDFINNVMEAMPVAPTSENDSPNPTPKKKAEGSRAKGSMAD